MSKLKDTNYEKLVQKVMKNKNARVAARENSLRRNLAQFFYVQLNKKKRKTSWAHLAAKMGCPTTQVRRLFHEEVGGELYLSTIIRALDYFDVSIPWENIVL